MDLKVDITFVFVCKIATINLVAVGKFFHIICKEILLSLFASRSCNGGLLELVSTYFDIVKTNGCGMLYLHYLVLLKRALHLPTLRIKI